MISKFIKGKVGVFIDASNILYSQKSLGWRIDYLKLRDYLEKECEVHSLNYYTGKLGALEKQVRFIDKLESIGYKVVSKEIKLIKLEGDKLLQKGNLDIELALDAFRLKEDYDTLLLFSGDSDFSYLLDLLKAVGKKVIVFSTRKHVSIDLLKRAKYIDLKKLRDFIELDNPDKIQGGAEAPPEV
jgi:uncharacterized LabA/DUF88 family protein